MSVNENLEECILDDPRLFRRARDGFVSELEAIAVYQLLPVEATP